MTKKIKQNSPQMRAYLEKCPTIYLIGYWAHYGILGYKYSGKSTKSGIPYVWMYYDGNGICDEWHQIPINETTTGSTYGWTTSRYAAEEIACALNFKEEK